MKYRIKGIMSYKKPVLWIVIAALLVSAVTGICFLTERPEKPVVAEPTDPVLSHREQMEHLLDTLLDYEDSYIASSPGRCIMLKPEVYQQLLSYDELALSYFLPKLRKADIHSYREYMMVYVCAELTGVAVEYVKNSRDWQDTPQKWVAEYDRFVIGSNSPRRLSPGIYEPFRRVFNGQYYELDEFGNNDFLRRNYMSVTYHVTAESMVHAYLMGVEERKDTTHSFYQTVKHNVNWQWESPDPESPLYTERAEQADKAKAYSLRFIKGTDFEQPLLEAECLYQPLEHGNYLVLSQDRVFMLGSIGSGTPLARVDSVTELSCGVYDHYGSQN